jgi:hypothetical protein
MTWHCWLSSTCYVCRQCGGPRVHARRAGPVPTSPCDTVSVRIEAASRRDAIRIYKNRPGIRRMLGLTLTGDTR